MRERWLAHFLAVSLTGFVISACSVERRDFGVNGNGATSTGGSRSQGGGTSTGGSGKQNGGTSTGGIGGQGTSSVNDAATVDSIKPSIQVKTDLVGFATKLDGSGSTSLSGGSLTYQWSFTSVPAGSKVTSSSLSLASAVNPTVQPDLGGDYRIRLTVTSGGLSNYAETTFTVPTFDVAYLNVAGDNSSYTRAGAMVKSDGQAARNVGCYFSNGAKSESDWIENFKSEGQFSFSAYYPLDTQSPTLLAYTYTDDATGTLHAQIAGPTSGCTSFPPITTTGGTLPAFSPNGLRIAMLIPNATDASNGYSIYTVGVDGKDPHIIRTDTTGSLPDISISWVDNTRVTWIENSGTSSTVYLSADVEGAFNNNLLTSKIFDCTGTSSSHQFSWRVLMVNDVMFLTEVIIADADAGILVVPGGLIARLWRLEPVNGVYLCDFTVPQNKILVPDGSNNFVTTSDNLLGGANDFELSPDGTKIVLYARVTPSGTEIQPTKILVGPSDGSAPFTTLVAADGATNVAPHWVAGGRQVIWTKIIQEAVTVDAATYWRPKTSSIWIVNSDGTNARQLVTVSSTPSQARTVHTGGYGGFACALQSPVSHHRRPFLVGMLGVGLAFLRHKRRRDARSAISSTPKSGVSGES